MAKIEIAPINRVAVTAFVVCIVTGAVVGAIVRQPALLIDEPFDGLDLRQARDVAAVFQLHAARGRTLFLSIHQISDAERFCDRFILLSSGRVRGEGTVQELAALAASRNLSRENGDLEEVFLALT